MSRKKSLWGTRKLASAITGKTMIGRSPTSNSWARKPAPSRQPPVQTTSAASAVWGSGHNAGNTFGMLCVSWQVWGKRHFCKTCAAALASKLVASAMISVFASTTDGALEPTMSQTVPCDTPSMSIPTNSSQPWALISKGTLTVGFAAYSANAARMLSTANPWSKRSSRSGSIVSTFSMACSSSTRMPGNSSTTPWTELVDAAVISPTHQSRKKTARVPKTTRVCTSDATMLSNESRDSKLSQSRNTSPWMLLLAIKSIFNHRAKPPASALEWQRKKR
mmetsp:Transcript_19237/g.55875  ORF Transcript_19237/g.55875 Transcript_19237/m.55875 type:complete len:278 (-) Transcript_19237:1534-2367(-)